MRNKFTIKQFLKLIILHSNNIGDKCAGFIQQETQNNKF